MARWSIPWHVSNPGCFLFQIAMLQGQESRSWPHAHFTFSPNGFTWMSSKIAVDVSSKWQRWDSWKWAVWNLVSSRLSINYRLFFVKKLDVIHFRSLKFVQHQLSCFHWMKLTTLTVWLQYVFFWEHIWKVSVLAVINKFTVGRIVQAFLVGCGGK